MQLLVRETASIVHLPCSKKGWASRSGGNPILFFPLYAFCAACALHAQAEAGVRCSKRSSSSLTLLRPNSGGRATPASSMRKQGTLITW